MLIIGLTGGIGSGKSIVAEIFQNFGIPVYLADTKAKDLMISNQVLKEKIIDLLGNAAYNDNRLNTNFIANHVFSDPSLLYHLNNLVHPVVFEDFKKWCRKKNDFPYVIQESAILFESGYSESFDYVVVVHANEQIRIERVIKRDGITRKKVVSRMKNQMDAAKKKQLADFVIRNNGHELITQQVLELHNKFVSLNRKK